MGSLLERVFDLLTSDVGNLTYHLILAFSIVGGLQLSIGHFQRGQSARFWRTTAGLSALLVLQLVLFLGSGLAWQGIIEGSLWLPVLDRTVTLISLIIIIWLWAFPDRASYADIVVILLCLVSLVAITFEFLWWSGQGIDVAFNGSNLDKVIQIVCLCLAIIGFLTLLVRRPNGWGFGIGMLLLISLGHFFQLFFYQRGGDYPGALRLGLVAAYPFLFFLPHRVQLFDTKKPILLKAAESKDRDLTITTLLLDPKFWNSLYTLVTGDQPETMCKTIVATIARIMDADICFLLSPHEDSERITIQCGFDLKFCRYLGKIIFYRNSLPALASSLRMGRIRNLSASSDSPDLVNIAHAFELERAGNLLSVPVLSSNGRIISCVVLMSPYSLRSWTGEDQNTLGELAQFMVHFLQQGHEVVDLKSELEQSRQMMHTTQDQLQQAMEECQKLRHQFAVLQDSALKEEAYPVGLRTASPVEEETSQSIDKLPEEGYELRDATRLSRAKIEQEGKTSEELRLALEEIAILSSALSDADQKIQTLSSQGIQATPSDKQIETLSTITQDLHQPLSSIMGYTDMLLGESIGSLEDTQRKYIERIKGSTERIGRFIDELTQIVSLKVSPKLTEMGEVDVNAVIMQVVMNIDPEIRKKEISLEMKLPEKPLKIISDQENLERVISILMQNAIGATLEGGKITIGAELKSSESQQDFILIQVIDSGGGISVQDLPRVFSPRTTTTKIPGLGDSEIDLPSVKVLSEMLGGRAWVDSEPEQGSIFSVLFPMTSTDAIDRDVPGEK